MATAVERPAAALSHDQATELLQGAAQSEWLDAAQIHQLLTNSVLLNLPIQRAPVPQRPPSGSIVFYNKSVTRNFRQDGYDYVKKKDGKQVQESHVKLKIDDRPKVACYYARRADDELFQRRIYWLIDHRLSVRRRSPQSPIRSAADLMLLLLLLLLCAENRDGPLPDAAAGTARAGDLAASGAGRRFDGGQLLGGGQLLRGGHWRAAGRLGGLRPALRRRAGLVRAATSPPPPPPPPLAPHRLLSRPPFRC